MVWVTFSSFISHLIGEEPIDIPDIFSGFHGLTGKTVIFTKPGDCTFDSLYSLN